MIEWVLDSPAESWRESHAVRIREGRRTGYSGSASSLLAGVSDKSASRINKNGSGIVLCLAAEIKKPLRDVVNLKVSDFRRNTCPRNGRDTVARAECRSENSSRKSSEEVSIFCYLKLVSKSRHFELVASSRQLALLDHWAVA